MAANIDFLEIICGCRRHTADYLLSQEICTYKVDQGEFRLFLNYMFGLMRVCVCLCVWVCRIPYSPGKHHYYVCK